MGTVNISIGHDDYLVVTELAQVRILGTNAYAHGGNQALDLVIGQHLVQAAAFRIQDFAAQGQDGLVLGIAALLGRTACRITLDQEKFGILGILALAVSQLAGQGIVRKGALAPHDLLGPPGCLAGTGCIDSLADNGADILGILFKVL